MGDITGGNQLLHWPSSHQDQGMISPQRLCHRNGKDGRGQRVSSLKGNAVLLSTSIHLTNKRTHKKYSTKPSTQNPVSPQSTPKLLFCLSPPSILEAKKFYLVC